MGKGTKSFINHTSIVIYRDKRLEGSGEIYGLVMFWIFTEDTRTMKRNMIRPQPKVGTSLLLALSW